MFTGIIENTGKIILIKNQGTNKTFWIESDLSHEFRVDQSISHNGVCLTIEEIQNNTHRVTAVEETLAKTNAGTWKPSDIINLERSMQLNGRLDGHIVQGHVDCTALCKKFKELEGSWEFTFKIPGKFASLLIEKGSVCVNGVSLTAFNVTRKKFTVAIIPYTFDHTNLRNIKVGSLVNIEFDVLGKYVLRVLSLQEPT